MYLSPMSHQEDDIPVFVAVYNRKGMVVDFHEVCSCQLHPMEGGPPRKGYITVLPIPQQEH